MLRFVIITLIILCIIMGTYLTAEDFYYSGTIEKTKYDCLLDLHKRLRKPQANDWLAIHQEEYQSFEQYKNSQPNKPDKKHTTIYIRLIGDFTKEQNAIIELTIEFIGRYFQLPTKTLENIPLKEIPQEARRVHPTWGMEQILTGYIREKVLIPTRPKDAVAYLALTATDLWPGAGWNFVFGEASLHERVGVWSIARNGDPAESKKMFNLCLLRTLKTGTHELAHMFSLPHCVVWECNVNGSNHQAEKDRRPLWLCPLCLQKFEWNIGFDSLERFKALNDFCKQNKLEDEEKYYQKALRILEPNHKKEKRK